MRHRLTVVGMVALVVLAGCSGGGGPSTATEDEPMSTESPALDDPTPTEAGSGGTTPTEAGSGGTTPTETGAPADGTPASETGDSSDAPAGFSDGQLTNESALFGDNSQQIGSVTRMEMHLRNSTGNNIDFVSRNDTEAGRHHISFTRSSLDGTVEYYLTDEYAAVRNGSTGQIRYDGPDGSVALSAGFTAFYAVIPFAYAGVMDWSVTDTRTIDGQQAYVLESDSINRTALSNSDLTIQNRFESVEGSMTVTADGLFRDVTLNMTAVNADGSTAEIDISMSMSNEPVTVDQPDWFDEAAAESAASSEGA